MRPTGTLINATESFVVGAKTVLKQYSKRFIHSGLFGRTYDVLFTVIAQWRRLLIMYWENSERWIQSEIRGTKTKSRVDLGLESSSEGVLRFQSYLMISQWCHLPLRKSGQRWSNTWVAREGTDRQNRQTYIHKHTHTYRQIQTWPFRDFRLTDEFELDTYTEKTATGKQQKEITRRDRNQINQHRNAMNQTNPCNEIIQSAINAEKRRKEVTAEGRLGKVLQRK